MFIPVVRIDTRCKETAGIWHPPLYRCMRGRQSYVRVGADTENLLFAPRVYFIIDAIILILRVAISLTSLTLPITPLSVSIAASSPRVRLAQRGSSVPNSIVT